MKSQRVMAMGILSVPVAFYLPEERVQGLPSARLVIIGFPSNYCGFQRGWWMVAFVFPGLVPFACQACPFEEGAPPTINQGEIR